MAGLRTLAPYIGVRILSPQPEMVNASFFNQEASFVLE